MATSLEKRDIITSNSASLGFKAGAATTVIAGAVVAAAHQYSPTFRARLGVSGKVGLVVMAGMSAFTIAAENDLLRGSRNPDKYISELQAAPDAKAAQSTGPTKSLPLYQQFGNYVHDYPFRTVACTAVPLVGLIFLDQNRNQNIQLSQKIMHTRIYGQVTSVVLLLSTMAMYDYMSRRGPYK
ncbi:hypothetical protein H310_01769 [Aphanomyces invadans]|uniref:HIG1 domain-containing protein n=1 Tax=Aphanomyces invadans TaxID=157072 RepID=A0A024UNC9_9STRA|nr:hypothetical protein H310_01767 [Aphanomyces invadans]XP_008863233.1 hypothetical protein H310_01769 [Aphanomyces invadans]ETW07138.1 hypothetical protein H310_01767 [Aphanomyces invadans]ETW07140.1 hypothetical protein H310_01769 [Aphanomyces invadans]|eukprot:XP_008863231.1 hypothetical protein H310_01767 [Aphanomyces invadans]